MAKLGRIAERSLRGGNGFASASLMSIATYGTQIGLTRDKSKVPLLCVLGPFLTGNGIIITP